MYPPFRPTVRYVNLCSETSLDSTKLSYSLEDLEQVSEHTTGYSIPLDRNIDVFSWRLELEHFDDNGLIAIGISEKISPFGGFHWYNRRKSEYFEEDGYLGSCCCRDNDLFEDVYGVQILNTNDIIELKFHQKDNKLEFLVNEVSQGIAFDNIPKANYRLVVSMADTKSKITLLK